MRGCARFVGAAIALAVAIASGSLGLSFIVLGKDLWVPGMIASGIAIVALVATGSLLRAGHRERIDIEGAEMQAAYDTHRWGRPAPTLRQFGYATVLGARIRNGMTKRQMSDSIDEAIAKRDGR
jgi:hypothetical protein